MEARRVACERTARSVSLDLDGELSRFERVLLARHLGSCTSCAAEAERIIALTHYLRAAPLEPVTAPIVVTRPRSRVGRVVQSAVAVAALAVVGVWFGASVASRSGEPAGATPHTVKAVPAASDGHSDWPAGLPRSRQIVRLVPGGLYTSGTQF